MCNVCHERADDNQRRAMRCGYLSSSDFTVNSRAPVVHDKYPHTDSVCAGYTTEMPDVVDIALAYGHWDKGQLHLALAGKEPTRTLSDGLLVLSQSIGELNCVRANGDAS